MWFVPAETTWINSVREEGGAVSASELQRSNLFY